jgi:ketosteroid isomerase-like protein
MWKILTPLLMVGLSSCAPEPQVVHKTVDRDADIVALTHAKKVTWRELYDAQDADGLAAFLADDFILIAGGNFTPKAEEVDWLRNNSWAGPEDFVYAIEDIVFITDDAAIIYGRGSSTRTGEDGTPCAHTYISSNTLRREGDKWHPVSSHVSDSKCEPIKSG